MTTGPTTIEVLYALSCDQVAVREAARCQIDRLVLVSEGALTQVALLQRDLERQQASWQAEVAEKEILQRENVFLQVQLLSLQDNASPAADPMAGTAAPPFGASSPLDAPSPADAAGRDQAAGTSPGAGPLKL